MKVVTIMWASYLPVMKEAAHQLGLDMIGFSHKQMNTHPEMVRTSLRAMREADLIILYRTNDPFWSEIEDDLAQVRERLTVVVIGSDPSFWALSTVSPEVVANVSRYVLFNGIDNMVNMFAYLLNCVFHKPVTFREPVEMPWEGIFNPFVGTVHFSTEDYLSEYHNVLSFTPSHHVGILYSRTNWVTGNVEIEKSLIRAFEKRNIGVIPLFLYSLQDKALGNLGGAGVIEKFLVRNEEPVVDCIVKLTSFFLGASRGGAHEDNVPSGVAVMKRLNIPLVSPVMSYYKSINQWSDDPQGLGSQVAWSIAMPEFEGVIEPMIIGATEGIVSPEGESYVPIEDRMERLAERVNRWISLRKKPRREKRIAFILHNNPCASVEATVGSGAHLDTLESVSEILKRMKEVGYEVEAPEGGAQLIQTIMERKALSEFRWTSVDEIVEKGGALALLEKDIYQEWFDELPQHTRKRMCEVWGDPPGEERDGIPPAMVHNGKIVITGVRFGNSVVCVQPKRGCAGAKCDGRVCKILHDPTIPPPHQYVATYKWLARHFKADAIVHVGTHGNLEFLPGKATGLSAGCFPDIGIDSLPHLYIYNADNPPEGTIAKRRSNAVLVDHLQTVMTQGSLYGEMEQLEKLLDDYGRYRVSEPAKAHTIAHMIMEKIKELNLLDEGKVLSHDRFDETLREVHDQLSLFKSTHIPEGMHVFGRIPEGERLASFVYSVVRYEAGAGSLRGVVREMLQRDTELTPDELHERVERVAKQACRDFVLHGMTLVRSLGGSVHLKESDLLALNEVEKKILHVLQNTLASDEMGALFNGFAGGFIEPGPSGILTRGRSDILPTGRNFYSLDPQRIPTRAAWEIGKSLAEKTLERFLEHEQRYPENIAFYWQCSDIMWADGEGLAQMMYLIGTQPVWGENGRVKSFSIIPLSEIGRPRIDITVRVSGITRDNFPGTIALLDEAIQAVASLDEPPEMNFVKKHTLERLLQHDSEACVRNGEGVPLGRESANNDVTFREATYRIFASMPGTYQAGTQLAVYASAWKSERDLADIFLYWNGYAYGNNTFGTPAHQSLKDALRTVDATFNKTVTDEYDLTGCCSYFGTHGGLINAVKVVSGREAVNYYGDTREADTVSVRTLSEELRRVARAKILHPKWIEGMKHHGYKGAGEISKRVGRLYGWQATSRAVDDAIFDDITRTFVLDTENRKFFEENNPWALEEIARRLIEAVERGLWDPSPDVKDELKKIYVEIEGWIEEKMGDVRGEFQGGSIDIVTAEEVEDWKGKMMEVLK